MRARARSVWCVCGAALMALAAQAAEGELSDKARRDQLDADRAAAQSRYEQTVRECERGFAVTSCVNQAKAERRAALDRASREQMALDDVHRKRRGEERRQHIAQKQAQQAQAAAAHSAASAPPSKRSAASAPPLEVRTPRQPLPAGGAAKPARRPEPRSSEAAAAAEAEAAERASQSQERRERAQAHEEAVRTRNAERAAQRAPAAPLPPPPASAAASAIR